MRVDLEPAKNVLRSFLSELDEVKKIQAGTSAPIYASLNIQDRSPVFDVAEASPAPYSFWEVDNAYAWIYGDAWNYRWLMLPPKTNPMPEYYLQPALPLYQQWRSQEKEIFTRGKIIPTPGHVSLREYLQHLVFLIKTKNEKRADWLKSLYCFTQFIREDIDIDLQGTLDAMLPYKMEILRSSVQQHVANGFQKTERTYVLRTVEEPEYPIDILAASDILINLAFEVLEGRTNAQHTAAEALGFAWLCHAVGSARLMTREKIVLATELNALRTIKPVEPKISFQPRYSVTIPSFYGLKEAPLGKIVYDFLIALPRPSSCNNIFCKPLSSLLRPLYEKGIEKSERAKSLGKITFRTFMSQSTHWYGHRPGQQKDQKSSNH